MAKRKDPVSRARGRAAAAPVKKPFPTGFVVGSVALVLFLVAILAYAVQNQGVGDKSSLAYAEHKISGLHVKHDYPRNHVEKVTYPRAATTPPDGGNHNPTPQTCEVYTAPVGNEHAVHSLEHGAVWITYNPDTLPKADLTTITKDGLVAGNNYVMVSPYPGLTSKLSLQAWGEQLFLDSPSDGRFHEFLKLFTNGPQTKERGAACSGTTATVTATTPSTPSTPSSPGAPTSPPSTPAAASSAPSPSAS